VRFQVMDALAMEFGDAEFDLVWACESGEHMPDKEKYVQEMARVLKPGGTMAVATWCQRQDPPAFTEGELAELDYLYKEWSHPFFISKEKYARIMGEVGSLKSVVAEDWAKNTIDSWRHSIWVGVVDPWIVILKFNPRIWIKVIREIVCLERMHRAFASGLMEYGMIKSVKAA